MDDAALAQVRALEDTVRPAHDRVLEAAERWLTTHDGPDCDPVLRQRVNLVVAHWQGILGQPESSVRVIRQIIDWASEHGDAWLLARSHRVMSSHCLKAGHSALALEHAIAGLAVTLPDARPQDRAYHLMVLADALGDVGSFDEALRRYEEADVFVRATGDTTLRRNLLNNVAFTHYQAGHASESAEVAERMIAVSATDGVPLDSYERGTIARAYSLAGRLHDAIEVLMEVTGPGSATIGEDLVHGRAHALATLAEMQRRTGALDDAQTTLDGVMEMCREHNLVGMSTELIGEQAEMHAARGDFEQAFVTFKEFHVAFTEFTGVEREAHARTMQAIYETDEARRDSARFRELSVRDPLTGLGNRRYVDEELRVQLLHALDVGEPLTLAIIDLDHFKVVNDQRSHEVGDQVLVELARILERSVAGHPGATASRLGGEEFLVLLPGAGRSTGGAILNRLCRQVREHPWDPITSGIAVTASIGVATSPQDGVDRAPLLTSADRRLYAAKHAGRDRVVTNDRPSLAPAS